jgi:hypothetical protein
MRVPLCRHLKTNGTQCKSPALDYSNYCFFHERLHERHKSYRFSRTTERGLCPQYDIKLHALEDAESIQLAISVVINALATGSLRADKAKALLYGLQLASINVRRLAPKPKAEEIVRSIATTEDGLNLALPTAYANLTSLPEPDCNPHRAELAPSQAETKALPAGVSSSSLSLESEIAGREAIHHSIRQKEEEGRPEKHPYDLRT